MKPNFETKLFSSLAGIPITKKRYSFGKVLSPDAKVLAATTALVLQIRGPSSASRQCFGIRIFRAFLEVKFLVLGFWSWLGVQ